MFNKSGFLPWFWWLFKRPGEKKYLEDRLFIECLCTYLKVQEIASVMNVGVKIKPTIVCNSISNQPFRAITLKESVL